MCNVVGTQPSGQPHHRILAVKTFILSGNLISRSALKKTSAPVFTWQNMIRNEALDQRLGPASSHTQLLDPSCKIRYLRGINLAVCLAMTWHRLGTSEEDFIYLAFSVELQVRLGAALGGESFAV